MAGIVVATVVELTKEAGFVWRALAKEVTHPIVALGPVLAGRRRAIVYVHCTVGALPAVDTNALIAVGLVDTCCTVLTDAWLSCAFIYRFVMI